MLKSQLKSSSVMFRRRSPSTWSSYVITSPNTSGQFSLILFIKHVYNNKVGQHTVRENEGYTT